MFRQRNILSQVFERCRWNNKYCFITQVYDLLPFCCPRLMRARSFPLRKCIFFLVAFSQFGRVALALRCRIRDKRNHFIGQFTIICYNRFILPCGCSAFGFSFRVSVRNGRISRKRNLLLIIIGNYLSENNLSTRLLGLRLETLERFIIA